ncbi:IS5 family transposase [Actinoplanes aureus]|uniref:IS5 family transposase n=1 Tax=Actinoplanes aureus TaxID=2792083 RepID=UPI00359F648A
MSAHLATQQSHAKWERDGTTARIHDLLRSRVRETLGRDAEPSAAVLDAQSVKTSCNVRESEQGIDAAKKIKGRNRHIATDVLGLLLAVVVTAASVSDSAAGKGLLTMLAADHPAVSEVWVDGGYQNSVLRHGARLGIDVEVVLRPSSVKGFHVLPRRWVVERTLGWLMQHRRLARDYEALPQRYPIRCPLRGSDALLTGLLRREQTFATLRNFAAWLVSGSAELSAFPSANFRENNRRQEYDGDLLSSSGIGKHGGVLAGDSAFRSHAWEPLRCGEFAFLRPAGRRHRWGIRRWRRLVAFVYPRWRRLPPWPLPGMSAVTPWDVEPVNFGRAVRVRIDPR